MPAAAVIPAPIAYIKAVAVKKLVVGSRTGASGPTRVGLLLVSVSVVGCPLVLLSECLGRPARLL